MAESDSGVNQGQVGAGLTLIGGGFQAGGLLSERSAHKRAAAANLQMATDNARDVERRGREMERRQRSLGDQALGSIRAQYAASGVTMEGSALDVLEFSAMNAEMDALTIRYDTASSARNIRFEGNRLWDQHMDAASAKGMQAIGALMSAGSGLL